MHRVKSVAWQALDSAACNQSVQEAANMLDQRSSNMLTEQQVRKSSEEDLHDITSQARVMLPETVDWCDLDPMLEACQPQAQQAKTQHELSSFFQLASCLQHPTELKQLTDLMQQGLIIIHKLADPSYDASQEFKESDQEWLERMISYAPDPEGFQAGRMHACISVLQLYFKLTNNTSANARKVVSWIRDGIKSPFSGVHHSSHAYYIY